MRGVSMYRGWFCLTLLLLAACEPTHDLVARRISGDGAQPDSMAGDMMMTPLICEPSVIKPEGWVVQNGSQNSTGSTWAVANNTTDLQAEIGGLADASVVSAAKPFKRSYTFNVNFPTGDPADFAQLMVGVAVRPPGTTPGQYDEWAPSAVSWRTLLRTGEAQGHMVEKDQHLVLRVWRFKGAADMEKRKPYAFIQNLCYREVK